MIVYGDAVRDEPLGALVEGLAERLALLTPAPGMDLARDLLIAAGELEQAVEDDGRLSGRAMRRTRAASRAATGHAAVLLQLARSGTGAVALAASSRTRLARAIAALPRTARHTVRIQVPEGYAFYALHPELYADAAARWAETVETPGASREVVVAGVRSIGTGLSALVAATLRARGWSVTRLTVRPAGPPFDRQVELRSTFAAPFGLVVDEGPGLSGSSMAATAAALERAGVAHVAFLAGHDRPPGAVASDATLARWARTAVFPATGAHTSPARPEFVESLRRGVPALAASRVVRVRGLGAGAWRRADLGVEPRPATCARFEREKLLLALADGREMLASFAGLAGAPGGRSSLAAAGAARLGRLARLGFTREPLGHAHGFVVREWIAGRPWVRGTEPAPGMAARLGAYVAAAAGPPLSAAEARAARTRLRVLTYENVRESLGEDAAFQARARVDALPAEAGECFGDGRMGPGEWIATAAGVLKVDCLGHAIDHGAAGLQPIAWDLAGALVEWQLDERDCARMLDGFRFAGGDPPAPLALDAWAIAHAAWQLGRFTFCAQGESDPEERALLEDECARRRHALARRLAAPPPGLAPAPLPVRRRA